LYGLRGFWTIALWPAASVMLLLTFRVGVWELVHWYQTKYSRDAPIEQVAGARDHSQRELTARERFFTAPAPAAVPKRALLEEEPAAPGQPEVKNGVVPVTPPTAPSSPVARRDGTQIITAAVPAPPPASGQPLGLRYVITKLVDALHKAPSPPRAQQTSISRSFRLDPSFVPKNKALSSDNFTPPINVAPSNPVITGSKASNETRLPHTEPIFNSPVVRAQPPDEIRPDIGAGPAPDVPLSMAAHLSVPNAEWRIPGARHQVFGKDCHGELVFTHEAFRFDCLNGNQDENLFVEWRTVARVDKNGVQLLKIGGIKEGKKYHFVVEGRSNDAVHNLFSEWFER
jgi:hypothetical protein